MVAGPYFVNMLNGIVNAYEDLEQDVLILTQIKSSASREAIYPLLDGRCDGAIFLAPQQNSEGVNYLSDIGFPHVILNGRNINSTCFDIDNRTGMKLGVDHLASLGHTKIGMILGPEDHIDGIERNAGFIESMNKMGLEVNPNWLAKAGFDRTSGALAGHKILSLRDRPTALCCANDETALGLFTACQDFGVRVPDEMSIVGFDNAPTSASVEPALTTIQQPFEELSGHAARTLMAIIDGNLAHHSRRFDTSLVVRKSTARPMEDK